jgi:hypothetical protein
VEWRGKEIILVASWTFSHTGPTHFFPFSGKRNLNGILDFISLKFKGFSRFNAGETFSFLGNA